MLFVRSFAFLALLIPSIAQSLDLRNDLTQYYNNDAADSSLIGDAVQLSGDDSSGFNISVSSDLGTKIETAYNGCSSVTDECYQRINNLLGSADLEINGQINRRDFAAFLSKTFKSLASLRGVMAAIIYSILRANFGPEPQPKPLPLQYNVPAAVAIEASVFGSLAPVTISLSGSPVITVTPTAVQSTLQGTQTPEVTAVTAVGSGTGNLVSNLDAGLGSRLDEIMHRMIICTDGSDFDSSHPNAVSTGRKRAAGTLGQAICAAEGAATMSQPGGSLNDLLLINSVSFTFNAGDVANAAQVVIDFVRDYSSMLAIDADTATQLGTILFALAIDTIVEGTVLGAHNTIAGSLISTGTITTGPSTTDTATSCSTHSACVATCDGIGAYFYYCETTCVQASGCATSGQSESVTTTATNPWAVTTVPLADYTTDNSAPTSTADPVCSPSASSGKIPALMAMELGVEFCTTKGVDFTKDARLTLGGGDFTPTMEIGSDLNLSYTFADGPCDNDCSDTVLNIVQKCAQTVDGKTWFNGQAMSQTPCGNYTIEAIPLPDPTSTTAPTSASSTATYRPESQVTCTDPTQYKPFTVANADVATSVFCKDTIDITNVLQTWNVITTGGDLIVFWLGFANDQSGCYAPVSRDNNLSPDSCTKWFRSAYNNCDLDTTDAKHGSRPLVWNSPNGCIEFWIYGGLTSYPG